MDALTTELYFSLGVIGVTIIIVIVLASIIISKAMKGPDN
jgi:hypothetical protein